MAKRLTVFLLLVLLGGAGLALWSRGCRAAKTTNAIEYPPRSWYAEEEVLRTAVHPSITDQAKLFGPLAARLGHDLDSLREDLGIDVRVVTSLDRSAPIERQANALFHSMRIGEQAETGGVLILMNPALADARIEVS